MGKEFYSCCIILVENEIKVLQSRRDIKIPLYHDELHYTTMNSIIPLFENWNDTRFSHCLWEKVTFAPRKSASVFFISLVRSLSYLRLRLRYDKDLTREIKKPALIPLVRNYYFMSKTKFVLIVSVNNRNRTGI